MVSLLERRTVKNGMNFMASYVAESNASARALYKKIGLIETK
jgi:ribosomal protein S18 acetylase RimI-like enzyme